MAYSEIVSEIDEQIAELVSTREAAQVDIDEKTNEIQELQERITTIGTQLEGLNQLKANAQSLIDQISSHDINLNINVSASGSSSSGFSGSTNV